ncbi:MAG: MarR family transcriptional regulator [Methanothrix sp.]|nr:MarR family transcriptional regulator [Methanothrix sp.]
MESLSYTQIEILRILLDDEGHAGWELAERLRKKESNLNPIIKVLERKGIIYQGKTRKSRKLKEIQGKRRYKEGDYKEFPYHIVRSIKVLDILLSEFSDFSCDADLARAKTLMDELLNSKYLQIMRDTSNEEVNIYMDAYYVDFLDHIAEYDETTINVTNKIKLIK